MECLCYGVAKIGDEVILKFTDDIDCLSPEALSGSYGLIYGNNPEEMLKELKGYDALMNFRGSKKVDIDKIVELLLSLSQLILKEEDISSVDFNPVFINEKEISIADFRIIIK